MFARSPRRVQLVNKQLAIIGVVTLGLPHRRRHPIPGTRTVAVLGEESQRTVDIVGDALRLPAARMARLIAGSLWLPRLTTRPIASAKGQPLPSKS